VNRIRVVLGTTVAMIAVAVAAGGVRPETSDARPLAAEQAGCGSVPTDLVGIWRMEIDPAEVPPEIWDTRKGEVLLQLGPGHRLILFRGAVDRSPVCVTGSRIELPLDNCFGHPSRGIYEWALRGDELVFTKIEDACPYSAFTMTAHPWTRVPDTSAPTLTQFRSSLRRSLSRVTVHIAARVEDDRPWQRVEYRITAAVAGRRVGATRVGTTSGPLGVAYTLPLRAYRAPLRVTLRFRDTFGNARSVARGVWLTRR
jgi:hypothetical protein